MIDIDINLDEENRILATDLYGNFGSLIIKDKILNQVTIYIQDEKSLLDLKSQIDWLVKVNRGKVNGKRD